MITKTYKESIYTIIINIYSIEDFDFEIYKFNDQSVSDLEFDNMFNKYYNLAVELSYDEYS